MIIGIKPIPASLGQASGDVIYYNGSAWARLPKGSDGKVLKLAAGVPSWAADSDTIYNDANVFYKDGARTLTGALVTSNGGFRPAVNSTTALQWQQADGTPFLNGDATNKRLGINIISPAYALDIVGTTLASSGLSSTRYANNINAPTTVYRKSRGTEASPVKVNDLDRLGAFSFYAYTQVTGFLAEWRLGSTFYSFVDGNDYDQAGVFITSGLNFQVSTKSTIVDALTLRSNGNVGISVFNPTNTLSFGGNSARIIWLERHTTNATAGNDLSIYAGGPKAGETNQPGGTLNLYGGICTGNKEGGVKIYGYVAGASGSDDCSPSVILQVLGNKFAIFGGTAVVQQSHIADASGGSVVDVEARAAVNAVIAALENYGWLKAS